MLKNKNKAKAAGTYVYHDSLKKLKNFADYQTVHIVNFEFPQTPCSSANRPAAEYGGKVIGFHMRVAREGSKTGRYGMSKKVAMQGGGVGEGLGRSLLATASTEVTRGILSQEIIRCLQEGDGASMEHVVDFAFDENYWVVIVSTPYKNLVPRFSWMSRNDYEFCKRVANHVGYRFGNEQIIKVVSSGWSFVSVILGQMTYSIASLTHDSIGSYVMQGAPFTQGTIPSIPISGSISPEGFLLLVLLLVVIIVTVVVIVILIVVVVDDASLIFKLSFVIIGFLCRIMLII
ncbi:hypothetical protein Tco_0877759 [Tanacetum coccineum]|uniref:Uncharacterized protein n=1 Tax=Tanacetum coccineum TaxID=301880 RepID=A0ABQ5BZF4_9ASTR